MAECALSLTFASCLKFPGVHTLSQEINGNTHIILICTHNIIIIDEDECSLMTHNCSGVAECVNTFGSFCCSCPSGYTLSLEGNTCLGKLNTIKKLNENRLHLLGLWFGS